MRASDWSRADEAVVFSDLSVCAPPEALAHRRMHGHWKLIPYQADGVGGICVAAGPLTAAPPLAIALGLTGWHALYLGLGWHYGEDSVIRARLSGDVAYQHRCHRAKQNEIEEVFLFCAELTGRELQIAQQSAGFSKACVLMYVRCVPMTEDEAGRFRAEGAGAASRRLVATVDGQSFLYERSPATREELLEEFERYRGSDFGAIWYGGADVGLASTDPPDLDDFPGRGYRFQYESVQALKARGIDLNRVAVEAAHGMGMKLHITLRPAGFAHPVPFEDYDAPLFEQHPEWRCCDRDETPALRMSFAVPEVRRHLVERFRTALAARPDGIGVLFNRGCSLVLWEEPFCALFRDRYKQDARSVDELDPRILSLRAEIMTLFMRELRELLDATQREWGSSQRLELCALLLGTEELNRKFGLDAEGWVREGLVDALGMGWAAFDAYSAVDGRPLYDLEYYRRITRGTRVRVYPLLNPIEWESMGDPDRRFRQWHVGDVRQRSLEYYRRGADGLLLWDVSAASTDGRLWPVIRRLGHREELERQTGSATGALPAPERVVRPIHTWAGIDYRSRFNPWAGG